jgi:NAD-dependent deacetylase
LKDHFEEVTLLKSERVPMSYGELRHLTELLSLRRKPFVLQNHIDDIQRFASMLRAARRTVVFTGAGMSTESGLPDFRSKDGLWKQNRRFEELASIEALDRHYAEFVEFYRYRIRMLGGVRPNLGHDILAGWQRASIVHSVITQNVDGLHEDAGSREVLSLHGTLKRIRCRSCSSDMPSSAFLEDIGTRCNRCRDAMRPSVVLYGEALDPRTLEEAIATSRTADLFVVLGSSLATSPANALPRVAVEQGGASLVIVNREPTPLTSLATLDVRAGIGPTLAAVDLKLAARRAR